MKIWVETFWARVCRHISSIARYFGSQSSDRRTDSLEGQFMIFDLSFMTYKFGLSVFEERDANPGGQHLGTYHLEVTHVSSSVFFIKISSVSFCVGSFYRFCCHNRSSNVTTCVSRNRRQGISSFDLTTTTTKINECIQRTARLGQIHREIHVVVSLIIKLAVITNC
jgi:hypothetical protein